MVNINTVEIPQKLKVELPYNPGVPLLDVYLKEMKSPSQRDYPQVHCSIIQNSQDMKTT